jgi:hypothetical protein
LICKFFLETLFISIIQRSWPASRSFMRICPAFAKASADSLRFAINIFGAFLCQTLKKLAVPAVALCVGWGEWWGSNPRQPEPQSGALPTELHPPLLAGFKYTVSTVKIKKTLH